MHRLAGFLWIVKRIGLRKASRNEEKNNEIKQYTSFNIQGFKVVELFIGLR